MGLFNARKGSWSPETPFLTASRAGGRSKAAAQGNRGIVSTRALKFRQAAQRTLSDLRLFRGTRFQNNTFRGEKVMTTLALLCRDKWAGLTQVQARETSNIAGLKPKASQRTFASPYSFRLVEADGGLSWQVWILYWPG